MKLFSALLDAALLPVSLARDVCTLGGAIIDEDKSATRQRIEKIEHELGME